MLTRLTSYVGWHKELEMMEGDNQPGGTASVCRESVVKVVSAEAHELEERIAAKGENPLNQS